MGGAMPNGLERYKCLDWGLPLRTAANRTRPGSLLVSFPLLPGGRRSKVGEKKGDGRPSSPPPALGGANCDNWRQSVNVTK